LEANVTPVGQMQMMTWQEMGWQAHTLVSCVAVSIFKYFERQSAVCRHLDE
jgi:hypothetical protein